MKKFINIIEDNDKLINISHTDISISNNYIFYNQNNNISYINCLKSLKNISPSSLKYSRKTEIKYNNDNIYFNISDVHIEVDFEILGVNEYNIFMELFNHIKDNMNIKHIFIVCLNFNNIKKELIDVFYSFYEFSNISFILITNNLSFIHQNILKNSFIVNNNVSDIYQDYNKTYKKKVDEIVNIIIKQKINFYTNREAIYELLIYNYNIYDCFSYLFQQLLFFKYLNETNINFVFKEYIHFIEKYNNNYRTIYHLESFIYMLINLKKKI